MGEYGSLIAVAVQTVLYLLGGYIIVVRSDAKRESSAEALQEDVKDMKDELKKLADVITTQAVQTERLVNLERQIVMMQQTIEALRRGNGFIRARPVIDGEYGD